MIEEVNEFEALLTQYLEIDDLQAVEIVIAVASSHKLEWGEMIWLRLIGASGTGKTELLRALVAQEPYTVPMESITPGAIRRGWVDPKSDIKRTLLQRLDGKLAVSKEYGVMLTKDPKVQKEIFGLLRSVYDGTLDADYGSDQGYLHQECFFDWILGATSLVEKSRALEYWLGSRFIDLYWESPNDRLVAVGKARENVKENMLNIFRGKLSRAMANILDVIPTEIETPQLPYIDILADIGATMRSPVERNRSSREIEDLPEKELGTRMGQNLTRVAAGLTMLGVSEQDIKPYLIRLVFNSMTRIRASVLKARLDGVDKQAEIAARLSVSQGAISRALEDLRVLGWRDEWLDVLGNKEAGDIQRNRLM